MRCLYRFCDAIADTLQSLCEIGAQTEHLIDGMQTPAIVAGGASVRRGSKFFNEVGEISEGCFADGHMYVRFDFVRRKELRHFTRDGMMRKAEQSGRLWALLCVNPD